LVLGFALTHLLLLAAFNRTATQPAAYYALIAVGAAVAMTDVPVYARLLMMAAVFVLQEIVLRRWLRNQAGHYSRWVAKKAKQIDRRYRHVASGIPPRDWFYVLHFAVTESIARPRLSRLLERLYFYVARPAAISTGIMQVKAATPLSDGESMRRGSKLIQQALEQMPRELTDPQDQLKWLANSYIGGAGSTVYTKYTGYLLATYPGLLLAWEDIKNG
jgi:hypothetical protein